MLRIWFKLIKVTAFFIAIDQSGFLGPLHFPPTHELLGYKCDVLQFINSVEEVILIWSSLATLLNPRHFAAITVDTPVQELALCWVLFWGFVLFFASGSQDSKVFLSHTKTEHVCREEF